MGVLSGDLRTLGREAFVYLYPLVMMDVTREQATSVPADAKPGYGPPNQFHHLRAFPAADFRAVVRPNFDTLYSNAWLDLSAGPVVLHVSDTAGRYFMLPLMDMWTDVFATIGSRTTGTGDQTYLIVGPEHADDPFPGRRPRRPSCAHRPRTSGSSGGRRPTARTTTTPCTKFRTATP